MKLLYRREGLTNNEQKLLQIIKKQPGLTYNELALVSGISRHTVCRIAMRLETLGLVMRRKIIIIDNTQRRHVIGLYPRK